VVPAPSSRILNSHPCLSSPTQLHQTVKPPVSDNLGIACRSKFFSAVIEATIHTRIVKAENDERSRKLQGSDSAGNLWLERCLKTIEAIEADAKHVTPAIEVDDEIREARKLARKTLASLKKVGRVLRARPVGGSC
jgi:hypothetical protein